MSTTKPVKVAQLGRRIVEVALQGATVEQALQLSGVSPEGLEIRVNGTPVGLDARVEEGDIITLIPKIRGG